MNRFTRAYLSLLTALPLAACSVQTSGTNEIPTPPPIVEKSTLGPVALAISETGKPLNNKLVVIDPVEQSGGVDFVISPDQDLPVQLLTQKSESLCTGANLTFGYMMVEKNAQGIFSAPVTLNSGDRFWLKKGSHYSIWVLVKNIVNCRRIQFEFSVAKVHPSTIPVKPILATGATDAKVVRCEDNQFVIESDFSKSDLVSLNLKNIEVRQKKMNETTFEKYVPAHVPYSINGSMISFTLYDPTYNDELTISTNNFIDGAATYRPKFGQVTRMSCLWFK
jgi:hypothetical protein